MTNTQPQKYHIKYKCRDCGFEAPATSFQLTGTFLKKTVCPQCRKSKIGITFNGQDALELNKIPNFALALLTKSLKEKPNSDEFSV